MDQKAVPTTQELLQRIVDLEAQVSDLSTRCEVLERTVQSRWP